VRALRHRRTYSRSGVLPSLSPPSNERLADEESGSCNRDQAPFSTQTHVWRQSRVVPATAWVAAWRLRDCGAKVGRRGSAHLDIDHDSTTGVVRGLLCTRHNLALGLFDHDPALLCAAIRYLKDNRVLPRPTEIVRWRALRTHCRRGHLLTDQNVYVGRRSRDGGVRRECRGCMRTAGARRRSGLRPYFRNPGVRYRSADDE
jgi:hypothetical protein